MAKYDPPSDPYGNEKRCRICDMLLEYDALCKEWYCKNYHEQTKDTVTACDEDEQLDD